jgi:hypothetical protein
MSSPVFASEFVNESNTQGSHNQHHSSDDSAVKTPAKPMTGMMQNMQHHHQMMAQMYEMMAQMHQMMTEQNCKEMMAGMNEKDS